GFAAYSQVSRQMDAAVQDAAPPPAEVAHVLPPTPVGTVAPIPAEPPQITPAAASAEAEPAPDGPAEAVAAPPEATPEPVPPAVAKSVDLKSAEAEPPKTAPKAAKSAVAVAAKPAKTVKTSEPAVKKAVSAKAEEAKPAAKKAVTKPGAEDIPKARSKLNHALAAAQEAGVPKSVLKAREAEWKVLYAKAQHRSPAAVAALYKTRAAQLESLAKRHHAAGGRTGRPEAPH
ncbi:MAG TPA: hypothetical protein VGC92_06055, partial [Phenylobacterium sp.]